MRLIPVSAVGQKLASFLNFEATKLKLLAQKKAGVIRFSGFIHQLSILFFGCKCNAHVIIKIEIRFKCALCALNINVFH